MNLLRDGVTIGAVIPTDLTRKLTIDGITKVYKVYKIRLDMLYYNDQNDRIATWISQYKSEHNGQGPNVDDLDTYNSIIEEFIVESNRAAIVSTMKNIKLVDQREPGVVLGDGRVIDGNRRFTCLRRLAEESDRYKYFEAVILERDMQNSAKQIKLLELSIQHGEESKVDYNRIDRLVGIYNDIIDTGMISISEYARSTNVEEKDVKKDIEVALLLIDFLDFINAPKQFYIARDLEIGATLEELPVLLKKCKSEDEREDLKISVFANLLMKPSGEDIRQYVRQIKKIVNSDFKEQFIQEQKEIACELNEILPTIGQVNRKTIGRVIDNNKEISNKLNRSTQLVLEKVKRDVTKNRPSELIDKAIAFLDDIDHNIFLKLNNEQINKIYQQLNQLDGIVEEIRSSLDVRGVED